MDFETVSAADFGASLRGQGLNLLVRDVARTAGFLQTVFGMGVHRLSADFAILTYGSGDHRQLFQLHGDQTYATNPLLGLLPAAGPRGAGLEIRLYDSDPAAAAVALEALPDDQRQALTLLQEPTDKPHGLREAYILDFDGYAWVPSRPL
jgi:catechol 2,3-dioxygenase-like lactoylglutathione lyase family enzyme